MNLSPQTRNRLYGISTTPPPKNFNQSNFGSSMPASASTSKVMPPQRASPYPFNKPIPNTCSSIDIHQKLPFMRKLKNRLSFSAKHKTKNALPTSQGSSTWIAESPPSLSSVTTTTATTSSGSASFDDDTMFCDSVFDDDNAASRNSSFSQSDSPCPKYLQEIGMIALNKRDMKKHISNIHGRIELRETSIAALEKMLEFEKRQLKDYHNELIEAEKSFVQLCQREEKLMEF
uniref:Uncharacterized protein n=1 Tax=Panagrolaimus sp. ES5 TaxID=591445 RepID=A0AC34FAT4_9BILA